MTNLEVFLFVPRSLDQSGVHQETDFSPDGSKEEALIEHFHRGVSRAKRVTRDLVATQA